jgi:hypothetical protein
MVMLRSGWIMAFHNTELVRLDKYIEGVYGMGNLDGKKITVQLISSTIGERIF